MNQKLLHEMIYRGDDVIERLSSLRITICGAGAVGSLMADGLIRQGAAKLRVIDFDRIEEHNVGTQLYGVAEVGVRKVEALRNHVFRVAEIEIDSLAKRLDTSNSKKLLRGSELVIDAFDNSEARGIVQSACRAANIACLHVGLNTDYGEVIWDETYRVPRDVAGDVCEYPLARNLVSITAAIACELVVRYVAADEKHNRSLTLGDLSVTELESHCDV